MRRVVVTGLGALTPLGLDAPTTWEAAVAGRSGVDWIRAFDTTGFPVRISEVKDFDAAAVVGHNDARRTPRRTGGTEKVADSGAGGTSRGQRTGGNRVVTRTAETGRDTGPAVAPRRA